MLKLLLFIISIMLFLSPAPAQSLLTFAGGSMSASGLEVSWSVGELVVTTVQGDDQVATQGYQQPVEEMQVDTLFMENDFTVDVITANGDGINDNFLIAHVEDLPNNRLVIINRWREVVYQMEGYRNDWQGTTLDGRPLPQAAYYYTFYADKKNRKPSQCGTIHVLRE